MSENSENVIKGCIDLLERVMKDDSVPRNIRKSAEEVRVLLTGSKDSLAVKAAASINILDEINNDPNIPFHTRTLIWNIVSQIETLSVE